MKWQTLSIQVNLQQLYSDRQTRKCDGVALCDMVKRDFFCMLIVYYMRNKGWMGGWLWVETAWRAAQLDLLKPEEDVVRGLGDCMFTGKHSQFLCKKSCFWCFLPRFSRALLHTFSTCRKWKARNPRQANSGGEWDSFKKSFVMQTCYSSLTGNGHSEHSSAWEWFSGGVSKSKKAACMPFIVPRPKLGHFGGGRRDKAGQQSSV